ncbi:MAG: hypothetical protein RIC15_11120 [Vicingaceae bacterium]
MLEFCKEVLVKVSFDRQLFKKELIKMRSMLKRDDAILLKMWCLATFGAQYADIIKEAFMN